MFGAMPFWVQKILHYEFWPYWFFYLPVFPYGLYLAAKARSLTYFTAANPSMRNGGLFGYSKWQALEGIPPRWKPKGALLIPPFQNWQMALNAAGITYPLIAKPDFGERGRDVAKIASPEAMSRYLARAKAPVLVQEFVDLPLEFGVFWVKTDSGSRVISITSKRFLSVTGDGRSTIGQLIAKEIRAQGKSLEVEMQRIPAQGETVLLEPIGNHSRGTTFLNSNHLISPELVRFFDKLAEGLPGFAYGRFDLKCMSESDMQTGEQLKILEVNGANSEITHIYQPGYGLLRAYRDVFRQMRLLWQVSIENHRKGAPYRPFGEFFRELLRYLSR